MEAKKVLETVTISDIGTQAFILAGGEIRLQLTQDETYNREEMEKTFNQPYQAHYLEARRRLYDQLEVYYNAHYPGQ